MFFKDSQQKERES